MDIVFDLHGVLFAYSEPGSEKRFRLLDQGHALLQELCTAFGPHGKRYACTNWSPEHVEQLQREHPEVMALFDGVITAAMAGARKPDPTIFKYVMETYALEPQKTVFIDDQLDNVLAARACGMIGLQANDFEALRQQLLTNELL